MGQQQVGGGWVDDDTGASTERHYFTHRGVRYFLSFDIRPDLSVFIVCLDKPREVKARGLLSPELPLQFFSYHGASVSFDKQPEARLPDAVIEELCRLWSVMRKTRFSL